MKSFKNGLAQLGSIQVNIYRVSKVSRGAVPKKLGRKPVRELQTAIPERLLKADLHSHRTSYGLFSTLVQLLIWS